MFDDIPDDAIGALNGLLYKIGRFGRAYYWNGEEWIKSEKNASLVQAEISKKKSKFSVR